MNFEDLSIDLEAYIGFVKINDHISVDYGFDTTYGTIAEPRVYIDGSVVSYSALLDNKIDIQNKYTESEGIEYRTDINKLVCYGWDFLQDNNEDNVIYKILKNSDNEEDFIKKIDSMLKNAIDDNSLSKYLVSEKEESAVDHFNKLKPHNINDLKGVLANPQFGELEKYKAIQEARRNGVDCNDLSVVPTDFSIDRHSVEIHPDGIWSFNSPYDIYIPCYSAILLDRMEQSGCPSDNYKAILALYDASRRIEDSKINGKMLISDANEYFDITCDVNTKIVFSASIETGLSANEIKNIIKEGNIFTEDEKKAINAVDLNALFDNDVLLPLNDKEIEIVKKAAREVYAVNEHYTEKLRLEYQSGFELSHIEDANTYILKGKDEFNRYYPTYEYHSDEDRLLCINRFDGDEGVRVDITDEILDKIHTAIGGIGRSQVKVSASIKQKAVQEINAYIDGLVNKTNKHDSENKETFNEYLARYEKTHGIDAAYLPSSEFNSLIAKFAKISQSKELPNYEKIGEDAKRIAENIIAESLRRTVEELISEVKSSDVFKKATIHLQHETEKDDKEIPKSKSDILAEYIISQGTSNLSIADYAGYNLSVSCINDVYNITVHKPFNNKIGNTSIKGERILGGADVLKEDLRKFLNDVTNGSAILFSKEFGGKPIREINEIVKQKEMSIKDK